MKCVKCKIKNVVQIAKRLPYLKYVRNNQVAQTVEPISVGLQVLGFLGLVQSLFAAGGLNEGLDELLRTNEGQPVQLDEGQLPGQRQGHQPSGQNVHLKYKEC